MKKIKGSTFSIIIVLVLVISGAFSGFLGGCSCSVNVNDTSGASSGVAEDGSSDTTASDSADVFGNYHPAIPEVTYRDEASKVIDNKRVPDEYESPANHEGKLQYEDYTTKDYDDDEHEMEKYLVVYTPYGYDPSREYDIMYLTHGHTGGATTWLGKPSNPYECKYVLDHLIEAGKVRPMIVVSMTYYDDNQDENTDDYDMEILNSFGKELRNDIIPFVESKYSTYAKSTDYEGLKASRDHRIMGGFSMGGVTACLQMCESMDYFRYYMPVSGTLYWSTLAYSGRGTASGVNVGKLLSDKIAAQGYGHDDFYMYISTGTDDFARATVAAQVESMQGLLDMFTFGKPTEEGVNCSYGLGENEGHNNHGRETALYNALPVLSGLIGARE